MLSTLEDGKIVKGLAGIPSEGPTLFVGYHMLLGIETIPLVLQFMDERNILLRGIAHPMLFKRSSGGSLPDLSRFDTIRLVGAVPVSGTNFYKLMSSKSHALLYPGGVREAVHRKGEEYKLFWPEQSEFVRIAARFGAKIIPFGVVGEDDFGQVNLITIMSFNHSFFIDY
ncbi:Acyltransferase-like protein, chloroplastic [Vitis vinifera]|nr:Acyltransferase-like protein, chloroplastic [Vitis vinifera]